MMKARTPGPAASDANTAVFDRIESNVRTYCRSFPVVFDRAKGAMLYDVAGRGYIDFFAGAGAVNYGHNPDFIKQQLVDYLRSDRLVQGLDMFTVAKRDFLEVIDEVLLRPRRLDYKVQFCGPTGAGAVDAALKLARLVTGRTRIASFTGGWHGMSSSALAVTGNRAHRAGAGVPLENVTFLPFADGPFVLPDSLGYIESLLADPNSGLDLPAAIILETIQAEGGIYLAPTEWLRGLRALCDRFGILLIVDDIQVGSGRTGDFFSFEEAGVVPDIVCLSKSIGGYGLPLALVLMRRELDRWEPGQHTGTFRGNQLAFVAATAALRLWSDARFTEGLAQRASRFEALVRGIAARRAGLTVRGRGFIWGIDFSAAGGSDVAGRVTSAAFDAGLIVERCGRDDVVIKLLPPIVIEDEVLRRGCELLDQSIALALSH